MLAGGGSLGAVQVGMLKALTRQRITCDFVAGASVGAINGAYFAGEPDQNGVARLECIWLGLRRVGVFPLSPLRTLLGLAGLADHLIEPDSLRRLLEAELPYMCLEDARIPCHVTATDVLDGTEVVFSSGPAVPVLLASAAIPGLFPPVKVEDRYLMDGGVANNTPISAAIRAGATRVIVLPTGVSCALDSPPRGMIALFMHAMNMLVMRQLVSDVEHFADRAHITVVPPVCPLVSSPYDFSQTGELVRRAEASTRLWLRMGGLHDAGPPAALLPHGHQIATRQPLRDRSSGRRRPKRTLQRGAESTKP